MRLTTRLYLPISQKLATSLLLLLLLPPLRGLRGDVSYWPPSKLMLPSVGDEIILAGHPRDSGRVVRAPRGREQKYGEHQAAAGGGGKKITGI